MKINRTTLVFLLIILFLLPVFAQEKEKIMMSVKAGDLFEINKKLASPEMEGRLSGTEGYNKAAKWAASQFEEWKLSPVYNKNFLQSFKVDYNEMRETSFSLKVPSKTNNSKFKTINMEIYKDFCPTLYSGFGEVESEVIFAGFGITAPELAWDEYNGVDVKGKIVAILRGTPQIADKDFSKYSPRQVKLLNAKKHGAAGLILVFMPVVSGSGNYVEGLPMVMVGENIADSLFSL